MMIKIKSFKFLHSFCLKTKDLEILKNSQIKWSSARQIIQASIQKLYQVGIVEFLDTILFCFFFQHFKLIISMSIVSIYLVLYQTDRYLLKNKVLKKYCFRVKFDIFHIYGTLPSSPDRISHPVSRYYMKGANRQSTPEEPWPLTYKCRDRYAFKNTYNKKSTVQVNQNYYQNSTFTSIICIMHNLNGVIFWKQIPIFFQQSHEANNS